VAEPLIGQPLGHHQQAAMSNAGVFQRAVEACRDGRGYTMR